MRDAALVFRAAQEIANAARVELLTLLFSQVVLLDVTGLKHVDTHTAGMLGNVAAALRLLGSETVITGIRPKIAQTLIALDINLHTFVTMATLQSGMECALKRARGGNKAR